MSAFDVWSTVDPPTPEELREGLQPGLAALCRGARVRRLAVPHRAVRTRGPLERRRRPVVDVVRYWDPLEATTDLRPVLARIACPTLVVAGEHDFICGPVWNRPIAAGIRGAEYVEMPGVGHLPQYEAPEVFRTALFDWPEHA